MIIELVAETQTLDWGTIIVQSLITLGVVFGGAGFWEFVKTKFQAKRDDKQAENTVENTVNDISDQVNILVTQMTTVTDDMQEFKRDLALLQEANAETVKYREARDQKDRDAARVQKAVIESLVTTGI